MKSPQKADLSEQQIRFVAERGGVMSIFTSSSVFG
jgi:hypothetical protein